MPSICPANIACMSVLRTVRLNLVSRRAAASRHSVKCVTTSRTICDSGMPKKLYAGSNSVGGRPSAKYRKREA